MGVILAVTIKTIHGSSNKALRGTLDVQPYGLQAPIIRIFRTLGV